MELMAKTRQTSGGMLPYRRFAAVTLVIALMAAMFGSTDFPPSARAQDSRPVAANEVRPIAKPKALKVNPFAFDNTEDSAADPGLASADAELAQADQGAAIPSTSPDDKQSAQGSKAADTRPSPEQLDRLIAASRERSGGVDQGDETRPDA